MSLYGGPAGSMAFRGPYIPSAIALTPGDLPTVLLSPSDGAGAALVGKASVEVALTPPPGMSLTNNVHVTLQVQC